MTRNPAEKETITVTMLDFVEQRSNVVVRPVVGGAAAVRRGVSRVGVLLIGCGVVLLPWLVVLAVTLPATSTARHWPVIWVGLDSLEAAGLILTGMLTVRRDPRRAVAAAATGILFVVDAWFDIMTSTSSGELLVAVAMAVFAELPLSVLCGRIALRVFSGGDAR